MLRLLIAAHSSALLGIALSASFSLAQERPGLPLVGQPIAGSVLGIVTDAQSGEPVSIAQVRLREAGRTDLSHRDGSFHFARLPPGTYTISAERLGYTPVEQTVRVVAGDTVRLNLSLASSAIDIAGIIVTGSASTRGAAETYRPTTAPGGAELRRKLSSSVAATLSGEPGISQRYNGPAAAQPVIRGLGGIAFWSWRTGSVPATLPPLRETTRSRLRRSRRRGSRWFAVRLV